MTDTEQPEQPAATGVDRIVVGVEDDAVGRNALRWALAEAIVRDVPLSAVRAAGTPYVYSPLGWGGAVVDPTVFVDAARAQLDHTIGEVLHEVPRPAPEVHRVAILGSAAEVLIAESGPSALLVVGTRLLHGVSRWLGSVSDQVVRHAAGPVALIPETQAAMAPGAPLVVGIDGSPNSLAALEWAVAEGARREVPVRAVGVWSLFDQHDIEGIHHFDPDYSEGRAIDDLRALVEKTLGTEATARVQLEAPCDLPVAGLLAAAERLQSSLLVVGARGTGGFRGLLLGSVCSRVLVETDRPVVVVPHGED